MDFFNKNPGADGRFAPGHAILRSAVNRLKEAKGRHASAEFYNENHDDNGRFAPSDYHGAHRPTPGPRIFDLTEPVEGLGGSMVDDSIYSSPHWFASANDKAFRETRASLSAVRGKPDALVTIYRSTPSENINPGDWVALSKSYAAGHGLHATDPAKDLPVRSMRVSARDVRWAGDDYSEYGYFPAESVQAAGNPDARSKSLKWPHLYDILRSKGYDKSKAAAISNSRVGVRKGGRVKVLGARAAHNPRVLANLNRAIEKGEHYKPGKSY
jgi:hypothetical protein